MDSLDPTTVGGVVAAIVVAAAILIKFFPDLVFGKKEVVAAVDDSLLTHDETQMLEHYFENLAAYFKASFVKKYALRYFIAYIPAIGPVIEKHGDVDPRTVSFPLDGPTSIKKIRDLNEFLSEKLRTMGHNPPEAKNFEAIHKEIIKALAAGAHRAALEEIKPLLPESEEKRLKQIMGSEPVSILI